MLVKEPKQLDLFDSSERSDSNIVEFCPQNLAREGVQKVADLLGKEFKDDWQETQKRKIINFILGEYNPEIYTEAEQRGYSSQSVFLRDGAFVVIDNSKNERIATLKTLEEVQGKMKRFNLTTLNQNIILMAFRANAVLMNQLKKSSVTELEGIVPQFLEEVEMTSLAQNSQ